MSLPARTLSYALPLVLGASLIEAWVLARKQPGQYDWIAAGVSVLDLIGHHLLAFLPLSLAAPVFAFAWKHRIATVTSGSIPSVAVLFVGQEFCYYWYHRAAHRVRWFWATHAVHHSPNQLNLAASYRLGWTGKLMGSALFFAPLVWLGFRPELVLLTLSLNLLYQFWIHATWIPGLGWLEYLKARSQPYLQNRLSGMRRARLIPRRDAGNCHYLFEPREDFAGAA